ncbi:MAG TPA: DUF4157 domain-containing protein [Candidatus Angelobacter sp.]|nr:DUF4157 domain-containing protein [Candidatus Angelobacter sp.]
MRHFAPKETRPERQQVPKPLPLGAGSRTHSPRQNSNLILRRALDDQSVPKPLQLRSEKNVGSAASADRESFSHVAISSLPAIRLQPKLTVNTPGDAYEQEADRVANHVMRMRNHAAGMSPTVSLRAAGVQRACACGGTCAECRADKVSEELMRMHNHGAAAGPAVSLGGAGGMEAPPIVHEVLRSPGQPLDKATLEFMEPRFGHDFSGVRVHTDAKAAASAKAVQAKAYTVGSNVVFGAGAFAPGAEAGQRLLAHELTHVVQQGNASGQTGIEHKDEGRWSDQTGLVANQLNPDCRADVKESRTRSLQRDQTVTDISRKWNDVNGDFWYYIMEIGRVNAKVSSPTRSDWINELVSYTGQMGAPGDIDSAALDGFEAKLSRYKTFINSIVIMMHGYWKGLKDDYEKERATLTDGRGSHPRALKFLDEQAKLTRDSVFYAWVYLTLDDMNGLRLMLETKRHLSLVEQQDEEERQRRHRKDLGQTRLFHHFRMRALAGGSISDTVVGVGVSTFEIEELGPQGRTGMLTFTANSLSLGVKASAIGPQSWTEFNTTDGMRIEDFEGFGRMTSASGYFIYGGGYSVVTFSPRIKSSVRVKSWGHGWGLGGGLETVAGIWTLKFVE